MKCITFLSAAALTVAMLSCTPFKMAVSEDLKTSGSEYAVKGRQGILIKQKLSFGEYETTKVKRSWIRTTGSNEAMGRNLRNGWQDMIGFEYIDRNQTVNFNLSDTKNTSDVYCVANFNAQDLHIGKNPNSILNIGLDIFGKGVTSENMYYVQIFLNQDERPWELVFDTQGWQRDPANYRGYLARSKDEIYTLVPVQKLEKQKKSGEVQSGNMLFGSVGFEIHNKDGKALAAVNMMNNGMIYLGNSSAEERFLLANLCTALLLQPNLN